jgi:hypothetical protein
MKQATNANLIIGEAWTGRASPATGYSQVFRTSTGGNLSVAERRVPMVSALHLIRSWAAMNINIDGPPRLCSLPGHAQCSLRPRPKAIPWAR